ncbi:MAG TPA: HIT family protein [Acidimicrobiales bacterium]|nr:HIT family protein [Acidimicrobiales bacterium]
MTPSPGDRDPGCRFCDIVAREAPTDLVLDEPLVVAFLDRRPVFPGHVLVVPRPHYETLVDLPLPLVEPLFATTRRVAAGVARAMAADGTLVLMNNRVSQSVPHLHVHVVPRRFKDGLRGFLWPRQRYEDDAAEARVAAAIRAALAAEPAR